MSRRKIVTTVMTVIGALGAAVYLVFSGFDNTVVYYKTVDELLTNTDRFVNRPVRVNGRLVPHSVQVKPGTSQYRFELEKRHKTVLVTYNGILPDTLSEGQDLVVQGTYDPVGHAFNATEVLTKCPSKYEAEAAAIQ